jgi:phospholipase/carboxylesterase
MPRMIHPPLDPEAVLWSTTSPQPGADLLIMMHGWSYDETHLFSLGRQLSKTLTIASLRAPIPEAGGYAWFQSAGNPGTDPAPTVLEPGRA